MALESKLQTRIKNYLKKKGWYEVKHMLSSRPGWPDMEAIKDGRTVRIEVKSKGKKADPLQKYVHRLIRRHGGEVYTVDTWDSFLELNL
jgi:Holliday junction resolvase